MDSGPTGVTIGSLQIEYDGIVHDLDPGCSFTIGREGDLAIDSNKYLHRRFLCLEVEAGVWWISNVGQHMSVSLSAGDGSFQARLGPGTRVPIVFSHTLLQFTAGPTSYDVLVSNHSASFQYRLADGATAVGEDTVGNVRLTASQKLLLVALCEPLLRERDSGVSGIPTSAAAAQRLGWPVTTFNRKLDNVCDRLDRFGIQGLRGGVGNLASNRKARLVEHALLVQLVTVDDLDLLDDLNPLDALLTGSTGSTCTTDQTGVPERIIAP